VLQSEKQYDFEFTPQFARDPAGRFCRSDSMTQTGDFVGTMRVILNPLSAKSLRSD
jgi:hypothetical protein